MNPDRDRGVRLQPDLLLDRAVRRLLPPPAPPTLLPRVMAAVQAWMARPWYQRAWFTWPVGWQVASFAFFVLAIAAVILLGPAALASATVTAAPVIDPAIDSIGEVVGTLARTVNAGRVVWTTVIYPLLLVTSPFVGLMFLLGGTIAVALNRVAFGRPEVS